MYYWSLMDCKGPLLPQQIKWALKNGLVVTTASGKRIRRAPRAPRTV